MSNQNDKEISEQSNNHNEQSYESTSERQPAMNLETNQTDYQNIAYQNQGMYTNSPGHANMNYYAPLNYQQPYYQNPPKNNGVKKKFNKQSILTWLCSAALLIGVINTVLLSVVLAKSSDDQRMPVEIENFEKYHNFGGEFNQSNGDFSQNGQSQSQESFQDALEGYIDEFSDGTASESFQ